MSQRRSLPDLENTASTAPAKDAVGQAALLELVLLLARQAARELHSRSGAAPDAPALPAA